jgi:hypothetical protein
MILRKAFLWLMIGSLGSAAILGVAVLLLPALFGVTEEVMASAVIVGGFSIICLACAIGLDRGRAPIVMWIGIGGSAAAAAVWLLLVWTNSHFSWDDPLTKLAWSFTTIALAAGLTGSLLIKRPTQIVQRRLQYFAVVVLAAMTIWIEIALWIDETRWLSLRIIGVFFVLLVWDGWLVLILLVRLKGKISRYFHLGTIGGGTLLAAMTLYAIWFDPPAGDWFERVLAALVLLTAASTLIIVIIARLEHGSWVGKFETLPSDLRVKLTCPRCGHTQKLAAGTSACSRCGLRIGISIEEPRCECGYLLYRLSGNKCPECGRAVSARAAIPSGEVSP